MSAVSEELVDAWRANARCAECGELIEEVAEAALVVGPNRVAHREGCFVPALLRANPLLKLRGSRRGAKEVVISPSGEAQASDAKRAAGGGRG